MNLSTNSLRRIVLSLSLLLCFILVGCARDAKPPDQTLPQGTQITTKPGQATPPAPWTGPGLATPYINGQGELELVYADARGTVKYGTGKGQVVQAALSPDRQQVVYVLSVAGRDDQPIYYVNASSGKASERELTEARDSYPVGQLVWSPCSQYLAIDSGTSASVRPLLLLKPATAEIIGSCNAFGFKWSPKAPSRLAVGLISNRQLVPVTEADHTVDLVVVDLPSGRLTRLASGGTTDTWGPIEWKDDMKIKAQHAFMDFRTNMEETPLIDVPKRLATADAAPAGSGALPPNSEVRPEVDFRGQVLLVDKQGIVQRKLTDSHDGRAVDAAVSADGTVVAYAWWAKGGDVVQIKTVRLPDLTTGEVTLALSDVDRGNLPPGAGPQQLSFGPGHILMANFYGWRPDDRVQVYDLDSNKLLLDRRLWMPVWAEGQGTPAILAGARIGAAATTDVTGFGAELSLVRIDVTSGTTGVLKEGTATESWWPLRTEGPGKVRVLRVSTNASVPVKVAEETVTLPE